MYTLYKIIDGKKMIIACCADPIEGALAIDADIQDFKDNAKYELVKDEVGA